MNQYRFFMLCVLPLILFGCNGQAEQPVVPTAIPPTPTPAPTATPIAGLDEVTEQTIDIELDGETEPYDYLRYLPGNYSEQETWPLVIYLHGAGSRGTNIKRVRGESFLNELEKLNHIPALVVAPQAPTGTLWDNKIPTLEAFLTAVLNTYPIDSNRIYGHLPAVPI